MMAEPVFETLEISFILTADHLRSLIVTDELVKAAIRIIAHSF
jgi:hypothetical protein